MSEPSTAPLRFRGHSSKYVDIGVRNENEYLAVSVDYAVHPSGIGCFIVRFVAHGKVDPKDFKHLTYRETAQFLIPGGAGKSGEVFNGLRLNKLAIPAFKPAVQRHEVDSYANKFGTWPQLAAWIDGQVEAEGFTLLQGPVELIDTISEFFVPPKTKEEVESVFDTPDLTSPDLKAIAAKQAVKPEPEPDEEDEDDGDEDDDVKGWLN